MVLQAEAQELTMATITIGLAREAAAGVAGLQGVDLLVFPELMDGGYAAIKRGEGRHALDDPFVAALRDASKAGQCIVGGSLMLAAGGGSHTNTSLVFAHGRVVHRYDKIHLFRPGNDHAYFIAGRSIGTFPLAVRGSKLRAGVLICYDLRFPELARALAEDGAQLLVIPARWPAVRDLAWSTLLRARAIENQAFVVGCNAGGEEGGRSFVFGPAGEELLAVERDDARPVATVTIDTDLLAQAHRFHDNIREALLLRAGRIPRKLTLSARRSGRR
jgi:predicted amidohydrolase